MTEIRVLTIEDDPIAASEIIGELERRSCRVEVVENGSDGLARALSGNYDAITLDRMLPGLDGLTVLTALRTVGNGTPVLMLSALGDVDERIRGLRAGGDDYLTKTFDPGELSARLEAHLRRRGSAQAPLPTTLTVGPVTMIQVSGKVTRDGTEITL